MAEEDAAFNLIETLIEDTLLYISENRYPDDCTPNRKRQIRRKAKSFSLKDNELFYAPGKDKPVCNLFIIIIIYNKYITLYIVLMYNYIYYIDCEIHKGQT